MRLLKAKFVNYCRHRDLEINFNPGLTAIVGPNGSGKSTILNGLVWCLTGVDRNVGKKDDNISLAALDREPAGVTVWFEHAGVTAEMYRGLYPSKQHLRFGDTLLNKDKEIRVKLQEILGASEDVLLNYVFVEQLKMFAFIGQSDTQVAQAMGQLFGTDKAERIYEMLGKQQVTIPLSAVDGDQLAIKTQEAEQLLAEVDSDLLQYQDIQDGWTETRSPHYTKLQTFKERQRLWEDFNKTTAQIAAPNAKLAELQPELLRRKAELEELSNALLSRKPAVAKAKADQTEWIRYNAAIGYQALNKKRELEQQAILSSLVEPYKPPECTQFAEVDRTVMLGRQDELKRRRQLVAAWKNGGSGKCHACGTSATVIRARLPEEEEEIIVLSARVALDNQLWDSYKGYNQQLELYKRQKDAATRSLADIRKQLNEIALPPKPAQGEAEINSFLEEQQTYESGFVALEQVYNQLSRTCAELEGQINQLNALEQALADKIFAIPLIKPEEAVEAELKLEEGRKRVEVKRNLLARQRLLIEQLKHDKISAEKYQEYKKKVHRLEALEQHRVKVREIFHRDNLQKRVVESYLELLKEEINQHQESFDATCRVLGFEDWRFIVKKLPGGEVHSASRLSKGEQALFALAYRIVINSTFAKDLGLLCLDEPTVALDADNRRCLETALIKLRELSESRGLQVLLVTHDTDIGSFDTVIRLEA